VDEWDANEFGQRIDTFAFCYTKIRSLDLNRTSEWEWNRIAGTPCLNEIRFDPRNNRFVVHHGMVLSKDRTQLLFVPRSRTEQVIPPTVTFLHGHAFSQGSVSSLVIPENANVVLHPTMVLGDMDYGIFWGDPFLVTGEGGVRLTESSTELPVL